MSINNEATPCIENCGLDEAKPKRPGTDEEAENADYACFQ